MPFARVTADGNLNELLSNEMHVVAGMPVTMSIWIRWADLVYTGTDPISFGVTEYENGQEGFSVDLASAGVSPPPTSFSLGTNDFIQYNTTYTVPDTGVDQIRMRFRVAPTLTAGTVDWSQGAMFPDQFVRDSAVPGVGMIVDDVTNQLSGLAEAGWLHSDSADALGGQNSQVKLSAANLALLQAQLATGTASSDDFERSVSTTLGANWDENLGSGNGSWDIITAHDASWVSVNPFGPRESLNRWIGAGAVSATDYQTIRVILGSKAGTVGSQIGRNDCIGRCDNTEQNYIRFRVGASGAWSLSKFLAGVETVMASGTAVVAPGSGSTLTLVCGNVATSTTRHFTAKVGSEVVASGVTDATSQVGASFRGWGFGGKAEGALFSGSATLVAKPGAVAQWVANDTGNELF